MKIFIRDGSSYKRYGGYGAVARGVIRQLSRYSDLQIFLEDGNDWPPQEESANWTQFRELAGRLPKFNADWDAIDMVLRIGSPGYGVDFPKPCLWYSGNGLSDLIPDFRDALSSADGHIVSSSLDLEVFRKYFPNVYYAGQAPEPLTYYPVPKYRAEGSKRFTFYFVGTFGYRKGLDILLDAFTDEFDATEARLELFCIGGNSDTVVNRLLDKVGKIGKPVDLKLFGEPRIDAWMNRSANRADCFISLTRGESWCLPICEAGLAGRGIIAPRSTAMADYLHDDVAFLVQANPIRCADIQSDFGSGMKAKYGIDDVSLYEPDYADARRVMRMVYENREELARRAGNAHEYFRDVQNWEKVGREMHDAIWAFAGAMGMSERSPAEATPGMSPPA